VSRTQPAPSPVRRGPPGPGRLLIPETTSVEGHLREHGPLPSLGKGLVEVVASSGLRGRGGASFPTGTKLAAVRDRRGRAVVVANGTEGEPASDKDKVLLAHAPHLVIDGALAAAAAVGARDVYLCIERGQPHLRQSLTEAVRSRDRGTIEVRIVETPSCYLGGEESALVRFLNGGEAKPTTVPPRPFERGVGGRPTLVDNVETLANIALIARYGSDWFRTQGVVAEPGTRLFTIGGAFVEPRVYEAPIGCSLVDLFRFAGLSLDGVEAVLIGGYFGTWLAPGQFSRAAMSEQSLRAVGSSAGSGVMWAMPPGACVVRELARVTAWLASQSARQCGPCTNGLPALARHMASVNQGGPEADAAIGSLYRLFGLVDGRGACRLPDGTVRFVASGLAALRPHIDRHRRYGPCPVAAPILPTPTKGAWT
jgi:NADH:ubiquinone oxidoreductase subunit F (NADH-binding)